MIYKHLSLAAGGGIIAGNRQAEQEECANVFIGLGGTGIDCLREVKKQVYNRLAPDIPGAEEPRYSHIQFLAIDTDTWALHVDRSAFALDEATECIDISCSHAALGKPHMLHRDPSLRWFSDDISILAADAGAGAVRQIGRLLFMMKVDTVISAIQRKIANALSGLRGNSVNIHIFTGLCGGTGSGIFLDLCYIVQKILRDMSLLGSANICGYFFLPDVNPAKVGFGIFHNYLEVNGFAAMKELDYCMNFENNGGSWDQNYKTFEIHTHQPPVKLAHLISARDEHGSILPDGYNYAMNVVVDYVMEFMTKQIVDARDRAAGYFSLRSHIANIERMVEMLNKESGACYRYHVLGASTAYIPYKDINSYLAARIFEAYATLPDTCHDIDEFVYTHGLSYKALLGEINKKVGEIPMFNVDPDELYKQVQVQSIKQPNAFPPPLDYMLGKKKPEIIGNYARNRESLVQNTIVSLKNALMEISTNPTKGPVYASLLLKNVYRNDRDMTAVVEGFITENERNKAHAVANLELREQEFVTALREFQNSNRLNRRRRAREYTAAAHAYFTQQLKIQLYVEMGEFLMVFKMQVKDLYDNFFSPLLDTLNNVAETFRYNLEFLNEGRYVNNDYGIKLVSLDDENLRKNLDEAVDRLDTAAVVTDFVAALIKQPKKWENRNNEARISAMVSEFFVRQLSGFTSKNIDEYLADKFNAHTQEELISAIYQNVLLKLRDMATPMFWSRTVMDERCRLGYCSVPNTSGAIKAAVYQLHQVDNKIDGRISVVPDRISMLIYYCGVPMFMFKGIDQYYPVYSSEEGMTGKHIYENSSYDERDFSKLSDLIPLSLLPDDRITPEIQQFIDDYREAQEFGIIFKQSERVPYPSKYYLRKIDPEDYRQKTEAVRQLFDNYNAEKIKQFLDDPANRALQFGETIELPNTGSDGYENRVVCDHVFASPVYTALMREQLALYRQFRESIHKLEETILC